MPLVCDAHSVLRSQRLAGQWTSVFSPAGLSRPTLSSACPSIPACLLPPMLVEKALKMV